MVTDKAALLEKLRPDRILAPSFFRIWDGSIARAFRLTLSPPESSVASYLRLMEVARRFCQRSRIADPLKALDEWAYVRYMLRQLP
ncbi:hypothetical protein BH23CHL7_BH23CHL7_20390 [soil metagenome]